VPLRSLFIDFNSYFAAVEQQMRPELRHRPVAVAPVLTETTCCIAVSYEAKDFGLYTGMQVAKARQACPGLEVIEARPSLYVETHKHIHEVVDSCMAVEEVHSIDEMSCALTRHWQRRDDALQLARQIKGKLAGQIGEYVRCSIGIAPNVLLAKAACDMRKPDGLVVFEDKDLPQCLYALKLRDLNGIGPRMEKRLQRAGIETVEQLYAQPRAALRKIWGNVGGERIYDALHGAIVSYPATQRSMVGHSHVLAPAQRNDEEARAVLLRLLQKAALRLRRMQYLTRGLELFIEYIGGGGFSKTITFRETQDTFELMQIFNQLWRQRSHPLSKPLMVGISFFDLVAENNYTPSLFRECGAEKRQRLSTVTDQINARLGKLAVYFAAAHQARNSAPMRIAFSFVPEEEFAPVSR
jgi:DNA polymerase IV